MSNDESYPCPPELWDFFKQRSEMHREGMTDNGWDDEADSITEMVDTIPDAFQLGVEYGMYKFADLGTRMAAREFTELRFGTEEELEDALHDQYSTAVSVHEFTEHEDGTATVSLSRSWSDMDDDYTVRIFELNGFTEATAVPYGDGYAVDFGPRPDLFTEFVNARSAASEDEIRELTPDDS